MRRRDFVKGIAGSAIGWPLAASAQQRDQMRRIGVLMTRKADDPEGQKQLAALRQGLLELGWSEDKTRQNTQPEGAGFPAYLRTRGFILD